MSYNICHFISASSSVQWHSGIVNKDTGEIQRKERNVWTFMWIHMANTLTK